MNILFYHGQSDVGKRRANNQDSFTVKEYECGAVLAVVCDGMGGASGGETASLTAMRAFVEAVDPFMNGIGKEDDVPDEMKIADVLVSAVGKANKEVVEAANEDISLEGMGTTLVSSLVLGERVYTVNVGDSRMYLADSDKIVQVTHDHSYVQYLVDIGRMTEEEAAVSKNKNIITRAVGIDEETEPDVYLTDVKKSDPSDRIHVLLCTDGLTNHVGKDEICGIINSETEQSKRAVERIVKKLIDTANENGGSDNITAVLISL